MNSTPPDAFPPSGQIQHVLPRTNANARSAAQLSDDIISQLYHILAKERPAWPPKRAGVYPGYGPSGRLGWIHLTHVCRNWRRVGLGMSTLWATIVRDFPPSITEIAERARDAPLDMVLNMHDKCRMHWDIEDLTKVITRCRTYADVTDHQGQSWDAFLAGRSLPLMHHLVLYTPTRDRYNVPGASNTSPLHVPALHILQTNFARPITASVLCSLALHEGWWCRRDVVEFLKLFPSLEQLHLPPIRGDHEHRDTHDESDESDGESDDESDGESDGELTSNASSEISEPELEPGLIQLPNLKLLTLDYFDDNADELLRHLEYPSDTELTVDRFDHDVLPALMARSDWDHAPHDAIIIEDAYISHACQFGVELKFTETKPEPINMRTMSVITGIFSNSVPKILNAMPESAVSKVHTLGFYHNCPCPAWDSCRGTMGGVKPESLKTSLERFVNVNKLLIQNQDDATPIFASLRVPDVSARPVALPALKSLNIVMRNEVGKAWWGELLTILAERKVAGYAIDRLVVRGTGTHYTYCPNHYEFSRERRQESLDDEGLGDLDRLQERGIKEELVHAVCRELRRVTLDRERQYVEEIIDERGDIGTYVSECTGP